MRLVREIYASWRAEVVFVTSNPQGNQEIMEGCMEAGIPAFVGSPLPYPHRSLTRTACLGNAVGLLMAAVEKDLHWHRCEMSLAPTISTKLDLDLDLDLECTNLSCEGTLVNILLIRFAVDSAKILIQCILLLCNRWFRIS